MSRQAERVVHDQTFALVLFHPRIWRTVRLCFPPPPQLLRLEGWLPTFHVISPASAKMQKKEGWLLTLVCAFATNSFSNLGQGFHEYQSVRAADSLLESPVGRDSVQTVFEDLKRAAGLFPPHLCTVTQRAKFLFAGKRKEISEIRAYFRDHRTCRTIVESMKVLSDHFNPPFQFVFVT